MSNTGTHVSTYYAENKEGHAEVYRERDGYSVKYFDSTGVEFFNQSMDALNEAEMQAENWSLGYEVLYG